MDLDSLQNKNIAILGLGVENYTLVKYLLKHKINCEITIYDSRGKKQLGEKYDELINFRQSHGNNQRLPRRFASRNDIKWQLGKGYYKNLDKFAVLFRSPGWPASPLVPLLPESFDGARIRRGEGAKRRGEVILSSSIKLFFNLCPSKNIIGVTGTKGKGTTSSLIYTILKQARKGVWLGGNIGVAPFEFIDKIKKNDWVVLELSSFQLEDMDISPRLAVITNFYSEHLAPADPNNPNYHKTLDDYWQAKLNIIKHQTKNDWAVVTRGLAVKIKRINTAGRIKYFTKSELPSKLVGEHNKENVAAAAEAAKIIGIKAGVIKRAVADFNGLEHRLELVKSLRGVKFYDDSFATTPESTIIALKSFSQPIILLLGGADKKADFKPLVKKIKVKVKFIVLLNGQATLRIKKDLLAVGFKSDKMRLAYNIKEAVAIARKKSAPGDIILLSTACASFGMFKNYKERGELFKKEVNYLK